MTNLMGYQVSLLHAGHIGVMTGNARLIANSFALVTAATWQMLVPNTQHDYAVVEKSNSRQGEIASAAVTTSQ